MNFEESNSYSYSDIKSIYEAYEKSHNFLLAERKIKTLHKKIFKLVCIKNVDSTCPFRLSFTVKNGIYEFKEKNSILNHNHRKFSKKVFEAQFFKRDFKKLEEPLREILEKNIEDLEGFKPKRLLRILKDQKQFSSNIIKGFSIYRKKFKKKFDNLSRKIKTLIKENSNNYSNCSQQSTNLSINETETNFKPQILCKNYIYMNEIFQKEQKKEVINLVNLEENMKIIEEEEVTNFKLDFREISTDETDNPKWIVPFTFY